MSQVVVGKPVELRFLNTKVVFKPVGDAHGRHFRRNDAFAGSVQLMELKGDQWEPVGQTQRLELSDMVIPVYIPFAREKENVLAGVLG